MKNFFFILFIFPLLLPAQQAIDTISQSLDSIIVTGYGKQTTPKMFPKTVHIIQIKPNELKAVESIDNLLQLISGIDIRTRGSKGVQSDISIRGGNFDQVLILLNGIPLQNPQTGHHALDLPVDFSMLERIEVLEGASAQAYGINAYSGAINLITKNPEKTQGISRLKIGQFGYIKTDFDLSHRFDKIAIYNGFSYQKSNGYLTKDSINNTDFYSIKDFVHLRFSIKNNPVHLQAGYQQKDFGANSFYTSKYPWQFEKTHGYYLSLQTKFGKKVSLKPLISYRLHYDEFQLFRESVYKYNNGFFIKEHDTAQYAPGVYYPGHNYHKTQNILAQIQFKHESKNSTDYLNISFENNRIWSNRLGELLENPIVVTDRITYNHADQRNFAQIKGNKTHRFGAFHMGAGLNLLLSDVYKTKVSGGFFINYQKKDFTHYINISSANRLPTYTDLYYRGPENTGNPGLQPETAVTYEAGSKFRHRHTSMSFAIFKREMQHTIDWIKYHPEDKWKPENLTKLNTYGIEGNFHQVFRNSFIKKLNLSYAYLDMQKDKNTGFYSKYVLDYLKHKLVLEVSHKFFFDSEIHWTGIYKNRQGSYLDYIDGQYQSFDYTPYFLSHVKWSKQFKRTSIGISVENLFDTDYRDLSYVKMPGRWVLIEISYKK